MNTLTKNQHSTSNKNRTPNNLLTNKSILKSIASRERTPENNESIINMNTNSETNNEYQNNNNNNKNNNNTNLNELFLPYLQNFNLNILKNLEGNRDRNSKNSKISNNSNYNS